MDDRPNTMIYLILIHALDKSIMIDSQIWFGSCNHITHTVVKYTCI